MSFASCGLRNCSKSFVFTVRRFSDSFYGDANTIKARFYACRVEPFYADVAANFLALEICIDAVLIYFVILQLLDLTPLSPWVYVKHLALQSGGFRFPLKGEGWFLTGNRHGILWTSVNFRLGLH